MIHLLGLRVEGVGWRRKRISEGLPGPTSHLMGAFSPINSLGQGKAEERLLKGLKAQEQWVPPASPTRPLSIIYS